MEIREFTLVIIYDFPSKFRVKTKILKFLGIKPSYNQFRFQRFLASNSQMRIEWWLRWWTDWYLLQSSCYGMVVWMLGRSMWNKLTRRNLLRKMYTWSFRRSYKMWRYVLVKSGILGFMPNFRNCVGDTHIRGPRSVGLSFSKSLKVFIL